MSYIKKIPSLQERASLEVALNLCQESNFKATALCLERPTYGLFHLKGDHLIFVSNPKKILLVEKKRSDASNNDSSVFFGLSKYLTGKQDEKPLFVIDPRILSMWKKYDECNVADKTFIGIWYAEINKQSQKLTENLPQSLKLRVCTWINRISLEYLSCSLRLETLFRVSRYFFMNFVNRDDWMETCRLDEIKLANRLLRDVRVTNLQRYRIASVYFMVDDIPRLWKRLSNEEKEYIFEWELNVSGIFSISVPLKSNRLVQIGSLDPYKGQDYEIIPRNLIPWSEVLHQLVKYGNVSLLMPFWKELKEKVQETMIIDLAITSAEQWHKIKFQSDFFFDFGMKDLPNENFSLYFNLMSYHSKFILFFLSEMNEEQQLVFFQRALAKSNILICFLHWPLCDFFLQTINRLWEILPKKEYRDCLFVLASLYSENYDVTLKIEYSENYEFYYDILNGISSTSSAWTKIYEHYREAQYRKANQDYDYRSLLYKVWEKTPPEFKSYLLFYDSKRKVMFIRKDTFLMLLAKRSPFQKQDETLFKLIFRDMPESDRRDVIRDREGLEICSILLEKEKRTFVDWFLQQCLKEDEIPYYKKEFIKSEIGRKLCFFKLQENCENSLLDLLDWSLDLDSVKAQFKYELIYEKSCVAECKLLLCRGEFIEVERIMKFCLASNELKEEFKFLCIKESCETLLKDCKLELMDKAFRWCLNTEKCVQEFNKISFTDVGYSTHFRLVFLERWEDVRRFYILADLSLEEIKKLKHNAVHKCFHFIEKALYRDADVMKFFVAPLRWCLTDEEMVINFKNHVTKEYIENITESKLYHIFKNKDDENIKPLFLSTNVISLNLASDSVMIRNRDYENISPLFLSNKKVIAVKRLSDLIKKLLSGLRKEDQDKKSGDHPTKKTKFL